ncbi:MAG: hypothetical protein R3E58_10000 [Phycisphaerae bacterium]
MCSGDQVNALFIVGGACTVWHRAGDSGSIDLPQSVSRRDRNVERRNSFSENAHVVRSKQTPKPPRGEPDIRVVMMPRRDTNGEGTIALAV